MRVRRHLTYANVVATVAMFGVVAGGGAYAASKIGTDDIQNRAVTAKKLDVASVRASKVAPGAITSDALNLNAKGVAWAGAEITESGDVFSWFNRLGGAPIVQHNQTGAYAVDFPGLEQLGSDAFVASVTVTGTGCSLACGVGDPGIATVRMSGECRGGCNNQPVVGTFDADGTPKDLGFTVVLFRSEFLLPGSSG